MERLRAVVFGGLITGSLLIFFGSAIAGELRRDRRELRQDRREIRSDRKEIRPKRDP